MQKHSHQRLKVSFADYILHFWVTIVIALQFNVWSYYKRHDLGP